MESMKSINLIFGLHWHFQPGQDAKAFEKVYQEYHKPFISSLYECEKLPITICYSGLLLEFLEMNHPEYLNLLSEMLKRKQLELLGTGYYEPFLPLIPTIDKIGQIEKYTNSIRRYFDRRPRGIWLPEMVWEPSLAHVIKSLGLDYIFLPEEVFQHISPNTDCRFFPCLTEDAGKNIVVFPLNQYLSESVFTIPPLKLINELKLMIQNRPEAVVVIMVSGEKYRPYFKKGRNGHELNWFKEFYRLLNLEKNVIKTLLPKQYLSLYPVKNTNYFPATASKQVLKKCLPTNAFALLAGNRGAEYFLPAFSPKQLCRIFPESRLLYAKMMYTHLTVHQMRGDKARKRSALAELWQGQSHYGFWQKEEEGLYRNALRKELYRSLINAEKLSRIKGSFLASIIKTDFDFDGEQELLYQSNELNVYIHLHGGKVIELDYLPSAWNYADSVLRPKAASPKQCLEQTILYPPKIFQDHFVRFPKRNRNEELIKKILKVRSLSCERYTLAQLKRDQRFISLTHQVEFDWEGKKISVGLEKQYLFKKNTILLQYRVLNLGKDKITGVFFASELNLGFLSLHKELFRIFDASKKVTIQLDASSQERHNLKKLFLEDRLNKVSLELSSSEPCLLLGEAVIDIVKNDIQKEPDFQQLCLFLCWPQDLKPQEIFSTKLEFSIQKL